jgi:ketosteroid isomerase-like protein
MSTAQNVALVQRYFAECVSGASGRDAERALALVDELVSDDFVMFYNDDSDAQGVRGREPHKQFLARHARNLPDDRWTIEAIVAQADSVACQWRFHGTYAKTGKPVDVLAADFFRVRDGRLAELRRFLDFKSFEAQLEP